MRTNKIALDELSNNQGSEESHISSVIVYCQAEKHHEVEKALLAQADIEIHGSDEQGKFVVVTEAKHQGIILDRIDLINALEGVVNVSMVYHQVSSIDDLDDEVEHTDSQKPITELYQPLACEADAIDIKNIEASVAS